MAITSPATTVFEYAQDATMTITLSPAEDITGWTMTATVRAYNGGTALVSKTVGSGIALTTPASGVFTITFSAADLTLPPGGYVFECIRTNSNAVYPIVEPSSFIIRSSAASTYPTLTNLSEVLSILNLSTQTDDQSKQWLLLIGAMEASVQKYCNRKFTYGTYTEYFDGNITNTIMLREYPVTSITSVYVDHHGYAGQGDTPFDSTTLQEEGVDYFLDKTGSIDGTSVNGKLIRIGKTWPIQQRRPIGRLGSQLVGVGGSVKVTYIGGYSLVPYDLKLAIATACQNVQLALPYGGMISSQSGEGYSMSIASPEAQAKAFGSIRHILNQYRNEKSLMR